MTIVCNSSNLNSIDKATPTNYQLVFPLIPTESSIGANNPFVMNIHSAILPSVSIATEELRWQGNKTRSGLIPMEFDPWLVSFVVDAQLANWKLLFDWMAYINNNNDKIAERHKEYSVDCSLIVTDNYGKSVLEVIFVSIWPSVLGEVSFSQREGDVLLESTINFNYDYFYVRDISTPLSSSSSSSSSSISISSSSLSSSSNSSSSSSSSSSLSSSSSSESAAPTWVSYTDDTYWTCQSNCSAWNGTSWNEAGPGMVLVPVGVWASGFVPTKMRVTFSNGTGAEVELGLLPGGNDFGGANPYTSGNEINLTVTSDIQRINLYSTGQVTNIEFMV